MLFRSAIGGTPSYNATVLEFDFVPSVDYINFTFRMISGEFYSYIDGATRDCNYNDGIAILIKPADNSQPYQNLALIPSTNIPISVTYLNYVVGCSDNYTNWVALYNYNNSGIVNAGTSVTPGTSYHIKIGVVDGLDADYDSGIMIAAVTPDYTINLGLDRLHEFLDPLCPDEVLTVTSKPGAAQYKWYKNDVLIPGEAAIAYTITQPGVYTSVATMSNGCDYTGNIVIEYDAPISTDARIYYQCDEDGDGLSAYYIAQVGQQLLNPDLQPLYYYHTLTDATNGTSPIVISAQPELFYNTVPNQLIYARAQNQYGCSAIIPIQLSVTIPANVVLQPLVTCPAEGEPTGYADFDLAQAAIDIASGFPPATTVEFFTSEANALSGTASLTGQYTNIIQGAETLYVRLNNAQGCYGIAALQLLVQDFGSGFNNEAIALCNDSTALELNAGNGFTEYEWQTTPVQTTQAITVNNTGEYIVTVTNTAGCTRSKTFTIFNSEAAQSATFDINDFMGGSNSVTILPVGNGTYQYSLDGVSYFDTPVFNNLPPGEYTAYIQDVNGCGVYTDTFIILDYPTFFSPNGDGQNDTWRIPFMQQRPGLGVVVYDRYGKYITSFRGISAGWDGTLKGKPLPATDYWFTVSLENGRIVKGHFSLIR